MIKNRFLLAKVPYTSGISERVWDFWHDKYVVDVVRSGTVTKIYGTPRTNP